MGGYAGWHHQTVMKLEEKHHARLVCTCDPQPDHFAAQQEMWGFARRGVKVYRDYRDMLKACAREMDLLLVPTPIPLHAEMHRAGVEHGLAVYLEKPPTLDYVELEEMIARDRGAPKSTLVGFNFIVEKPRLALKERLLAGEFGPLREAHLSAMWARPRSYFNRNTWAGRLLGDDGRLILDSCFGNAMAHFVHNLLFWAGSPELMSWTEVSGVQAELYRAHDIEGADTFFVEARNPSGVVLRFALTHACPGPSSHAEILVCEHATVRYVVGQQAEVRWRDGRVERIVLEPFDALAENHLEYYRYLHGESPRPVTLLADSRPFVMLNDLAYVSSGTITPIPGSRISPVRNEKEQQDYLAINGLNHAMDEFLSLGRWPGAQGWERPDPPSLVTLDDLPRFRAAVDAMVAAGKPPRKD